MDIVFCESCEWFGDSLNLQAPEHQSENFCLCPNCKEKDSCRELIEVK